MSNGGHDGRLPRRHPGYLRTLRRQAKLTQAELAEQSGISQPNISHLELQAPRTQVKRDTVAALARVLNVPTRLLRFGPDPRVKSALRGWRRERAPRVPRALAADGGAVKAAQAEARPVDTILRMAEVTARVGLSRRTLYRLVRAGRSPKPVRLTEVLIGWRASDINRWIAEGGALRA